MSGPSDVSEFVDDTEDGVGEGIGHAKKGLKNMYLTSWKHSAESIDAQRTQKAIERSAAQRDVKITLPKLKFLDEPENGL
jgi:hypothetical protein